MIKGLRSNIKALKEIIKDVMELVNEVGGVVNFTRYVIWFLYRMARNCNVGVGTVVIISIPRFCNDIAYLAGLTYPNLEYNGMKGIVVGGPYEGDYSILLIGATESKEFWIAEFKKI